MVTAYRTASPGPGGAIRSKLELSRAVSRLQTCLSFLLTYRFLRRRTGASSGSSSLSEWSLKSEQENNQNIPMLRINVGPELFIISIWLQEDTRKSKKLSKICQQLFFFYKVIFWCKLFVFTRLRFTGFNIFSCYLGFWDRFRTRTEDFWILQKGGLKNWPLLSSSEKYLPPPGRRMSGGKI